MYIKWSPIDSVTASAKSFELSILKKYSNFMLNDAEQCENSDCNCVKKISVIFVLYRFMVIVSYLFFLGGLWQLEVILKKTIRNRCGNCQKKRIKSTKKLCKHCSISEGNNNVSSLDNNDFSEDEQQSSVLNSFNDCINENVHIVNYREEETEADGFLDDEYIDILANSQFAEDDHKDLELLLQPLEINWDSPVPIELTPSLDDSFRDDSSEIYFDEDYVSILGVDAQNSFEALTNNEQLEDANEPFSSEPVRAMLDVPSSNSPIFDDEVVAAIIGNTSQEVFLPSGFENETEWLYA
uniref:(northern house mosquito) hypothetical protein n=1 Tax=Culex pipiens TaxID=7175 RepID=A0A8D8I448_CULPI